MPRPAALGGLRQHLQMNATTPEVHMPPVAKEDVVPGGKHSRIQDCLPKLTSAFPRAWTSPRNQGDQSSTGPRSRKESPGRVRKRREEAPRDRDGREWDWEPTPLCLTLVGATGQVIHTVPGEVWSLSGLYQGAYPSFWAEGPIGRTFQEALFYRPQWIIQGHHAL